MITQLSEHPTLKDLMELKHHRCEDLTQLRRKLQLAIQLEFATVPIYLTALYSISDTTTEAYRLILSVVIEEMFHMNQAANLLIGVGGKPVFTGPAVPDYPTYLPNADQDTTPYVSLRKASKSLIRNVFMKIEKPAPYFAPAEGESYSTIGQFYKAIEEDLIYLTDTLGEQAVFEQSPDVQQRLDYYNIGQGGGELIEITDLKSALAAINAIVEQGEGAVDPTQTLVPYQPFGTYNRYGNRLDGTYGPILGTPYELSHYFKFQKITEEAVAFPATYPVVEVPNINVYDDTAKDLCELFNAAYTVMLRSMEKSFEAGEEARKCFYQIALPLMHNELPVLARQLMQTPIWSEGNAQVGPNAMPTFQYLSDMNMEKYVDRLKGYVHKLTAEEAVQEVAKEVIKEVATTAKELHQLCDHANGLKHNAQKANINL